MLNQLKPKTKIGLILIFVGTIILILVMGIFYLIHFPVSALFILLIVCVSIIWFGINFTYHDLSQRDRGIILNIIGIALTGSTALIIFLIDVWMDSLIVLVVIFALLWFFIFNVPGLYKAIKKEDFPDLYKFLDLYACASTIFLIICTIIIAVFQKQNFSEYYFSNLGVLILIAIFIPAIVSFIIYIGYKIRY